MDDHADEEIVALVQAGEDVADNMMILYRRMLPVIRGMARRYGAGRQQDMADLLQSGYIGIHRAALAYRPGGAPYRVYAHYWIRREMSRCLAGMDIDRGCDRLDACPPGTDLQLVDQLPGPDGPDVTVVDDMAARECAAVLWGMVDDLQPGPRQAIYCRYRDGMDTAAAGAAIGADPGIIRKWQRAGLADLRRPDNRARLVPYLDLGIYSMGIRGTGVTAFRRTWTSATERAALQLADSR